LSHRRRSRLSSAQANATGKACHWALLFSPVASAAHVQIPCGVLQHRESAVATDASHQMRGPTVLSGRCRNHHSRISPVGLSRSPRSARPSFLEMEIPDTRQHTAEPALSGRGGGNGTGKFPGCRILGLKVLSCGLGRAVPGAGGAAVGLARRRRLHVKGKTARNRHWPNGAEVLDSRFSPVWVEVRDTSHYNDARPHGVDYVLALPRGNGERRVKRRSGRLPASALPQSSTQCASRPHLVVRACTDRPREWLSSLASVDPASCRRNCPRGGGLLYVATSHAANTRPGG